MAKRNTGLSSQIVLHDDQHNDNQGRLTLTESGGLIMFRIRISIVLAILLSISNGCALFGPKRQTEFDPPLRHRPEAACIDQGILRIGGWMSRSRSFNRYSVHVNSVVDDMGNDLEFKGFRFNWVKGMLFVLSFKAPRNDISTVTYDISFNTRTGTDRVQGTLPITEDPPFYMCQNKSLRSAM